jgi:splicing factor 45
MVGPGEIDDMLEKETTQECEKYGTVLGCIAIEDTRPGVLADDAVKIFVKFKYEDQSLKGWFICKRIVMFSALLDLDGRFFGGRTVRADYYPEERFNNRDF